MAGWMGKNIWMVGWLEKMDGRVDGYKNIYIIDVWLDGYELIFEKKQKDGWQDNKN